MQYTSIEDVEKVYDELFPWDKEKFIEKHINDNNINFQDLKFNNLQKCLKNLGYSNEDILDLIDDNDIRKYVYDNEIL